MPKPAPTSARDFRVRWEINLYAASPEDAARQALAIQRDPNSLATIFEVKWRDPDNVYVYVDANGPRKRKNKLLVDAAAVKAEPPPKPAPMDPAECTVDGRTYVAVEGEDCKGCAANSPGGPACYKTGPCSSFRRPDGRSVIWVRQDA